VIIREEDYIKHYGTPRHSGRYPWGSGKDPYQSNKSFLGMVAELRHKGMSDAEIARSLGMKRSELQAKRSIAKSEQRMADIAQAQRLRDKGWSKVEIGRRMGLNESSVRALLAPGAADKAKTLNATADMLKRQVEEKGIIDIGSNVEYSFPGAPGTDQIVGISRTKLETAVAKLKEEGYEVHKVKVPQLGIPGQFTTTRVMAPPGMTYGEIMKNQHKIRQITEHSDDGGRTYTLGMERRPTSIDSKRVKINYAEDGGADADGVIYIRPGVEDVSLGKSNYAQVRIAVDGTHFLKGMAVYKTGLPAGADLVFNTNKTRAEAPTKHAAMKPMKTIKVDGIEVIDEENPFGATIMPGGQRGVMNIISEEGTWSDWSRTLSSQFLSKQSPALAKQQLNMTFERKLEDFDEIMSLTNPTVRRHLLMSFAEDADSSAQHLKAAALPRQGNHVLLPVPSMKPNEIFAPNYDDGDRVVLIRHPHGGIFEIPELTVNNRHREARRLIGSQSPDAVGIHPRVAAKLSGADFDGDHVVVIRNNRQQVATAPSLEGLKNFDPIRSFPGYEGMPKMKDGTKQNEMGGISNLITDMTIKGATPNELARAVRHSMVVIDAQKHDLNYKLSAQVNGIAALKEKYQGGPRRGASTLISLAGSTTRIPERKMGFRIDPATGKKIYTPTGATYVDKRGRTVERKTKVNRLTEAEDAHTLSSGTPIEQIYADHSNRLKALANTARKEGVAIKTTPASPAAKEAYANEVASLKSKLRIAEMNSPRERQAQIVGNAIVAQKRAANPDMDQDELKKLRTQALAEARTRTGANKDLVEITPSEWEAIQAHAISHTMLADILKNTDVENVKQLATPKTRPTMTTAKVARAKGMAALGYTQAEIAEQLGVSVSTITDVLSEGG
jgi:DNA-binding NarL/FixJ family response regulator